MARPIRGIEVFLPLDYNDGRPIPASKFTAVQEELLARFGGVTSMQRQFPLQGIWKSGDDIYHDRVVVFSVMDFRAGTQIESLRYLGATEDPLEKAF
jgi:hypothetical protein